MQFFKQLFAADTTSLNAQEAHSRLQDQKPAPFILDVRQPDEYKAGHIPGAVLIPLNDLGSRIKELPKDREILCVCRSGSRSAAAHRQLQNAGFTSFNLSGGMIAWQHAGLSVKTGNGR